MGISTVGAVFLLAVTSLANPLGPESLGQRSEKFAADVYKIISENSGNSLFCPISMQSLLALVQTGANGRTLEQMSKALHLSQDKSETQHMFRKLTAKIRTLENVTLSSANKIFVREGFLISDTFKDIAIESFEAELENVNFVDTVKTASDINQWVADRTDEKIKSIITEHDLDQSTAMVLVNALYFNGHWKRFFDSEFTEKKLFHVNSTNATKVDMMVQLDVLEYAANQYAKFVDIPYANEEFVMTVILPNKKHGLAEVEANIEEALKVQDTYPSEVTLMLPKFKIEGEIDFKKVLMKLGMTDVFSKAADLTGISATGKNLYITKVVQKSYIDVSEEGTEAASVSAGILTDRISSPPRIDFVADHPFLFVIRQRSTGVIEFLGRFTGA